MNTETSQRPRVFISYSHKDREWLERLHVHLKPLKGVIELWDDTGVAPGSLWREEIHAGLSAPRVAILLVSADFMASDFITSEELPALLKCARGGATDLLIIVVSAAMLSAVEGLAEFQTVNDPKLPLIDMDRGKQEQVFLSVAYHVELALRRQAADAVPASGGGRRSEDAKEECAGVAPPMPPPGSDCHYFAAVFDIYIKREQRSMPLSHAAAVVTPLVGLALLLSAWLMLDIKQNPAVVVALITVGLVAFGLSYVLMNKVHDGYTAIESCEFMKRKFDECERWDAAQLREHIAFAMKFLKRDSP